MIFCFIYCVGYWTNKRWILLIIKFMKYKETMEWIMNKKSRTYSLRIKLKWHKRRDRFVFSDVVRTDGEICQGKHTFLHRAWTMNSGSWKGLSKLQLSRLKSQFETLKSNCLKFYRHQDNLSYDIIHS